MKYPQLVSPRAVNAISDWLVSRLEQLGVESPQIYTRLLLSLLQSSVQVNDPIEFSNLEAFFANHKGGHKRFYLPSDTETLKKLNAVQCLREIVSNEQETAAIEQLVDELCEKLKDIEKQTQNLSEEERFLIETHLDTGSQQQSQQHPSSSNYNNPLHNTRHHQHNHHYHHQPQQDTQNTQNKRNHASFNIDAKRQHIISNSSSLTRSDPLSDLDNDPKKRYFRAFPALSKEMEDSFRIWRRNAKSLTWPVVGSSTAVDNQNNSSASSSSSCASSIISSSNFGANNISTDKVVEKKLKTAVGHVLQNKVNADISASACSAYSGGSDVQQQHQGAVAAGAKKKSKRRRNQALSKGRTVSNTRKLSVGTTSNSVGGNKYHQHSHHRNSSPAWDTDFQGCWEMGPDLIKEFLSRQNDEKNDRISSDSMDHEENNEREILNGGSLASDEIPVLKRYIDLSFCYDDEDEEINDHDDEIQLPCTEEGVDYVDEDYDDNTLASVSNFSVDNINPKRLYQREGHSQKPLSFGVTLVTGNFAADSSLDESGDSVDPLDFQKFKAKFNRNVEALWKDVESMPAISSEQSSVTAQNVANSPKLNNPVGGGISSAFYATTSLNALAPFKKDLWNFWSNYEQQSFDNVKNELPFTTSSSSILTNIRLEDSSINSGVGADIANSSDYFSMPSNLNDFDKSVGSVRRTNEAGASLGAHTPSINVFLRNSIWSTSDDCVDTIGTTSAANAADTDESFLFKVWHSNKKLSELDVGNAVKGEKRSTLGVDIEAVDGTDLNKSREPASIVVKNQNLGGNLQFPPYQNLKWSEGINAGPPFGSLRTHANLNHYTESQPMNESSYLRKENNHASFSSVASLSGATWEAPAFGQNTQPDLKSWCASNPISLTEMYGNDVCDSIVNQPVVEDELNLSEMEMETAVSLPNHCVQTSGFVAYSRIKQCSLFKPQPKSLLTASAARLPKEFFINSEEENLLKSELTHFRPIENFVDGHTFDISNALDTIEFERTSSGLMRYESEEYLDYTRSDIYMADEEVATNSTNLLKYARKTNEDRDKFIIKFRVKRSGEVACQTDEQDFQLVATKVSELPAVTAFLPSLDVSNMFHNTFSLSRQANNEAIMDAVTKAVAAAAKAAAENHLHRRHICWLPITNINSNETESDTKSGESTQHWRADNSICDEVDFCEMDNSVRQQQLAQNWSMQEVEKQCHQRRWPSQPQEQEIKTKRPTKADIDRSEENSLDNTSLHTLWGMCAVCNNCELNKSMPANRLLRDELQLEADEIMSDLRYMQDLYIGESNILNEGTEAQSTTQNNIAMDDKMFDYFNKDINVLENSPDKMDIRKNKDQHDTRQVTMLQKVNQLIEDLLKSENAGKLPNERIEQENVIKQTKLSHAWNVQAEHEMPSFWQFSEQEDNIWQRNLVKEQLHGPTNKKDEEFLKPMKLLKEVGGSLGANKECSPGPKWEHDNLAKIWQQSVISSTQLEETLEKESGDETIKGNLLERQEGGSLHGSQKIVEEKNQKNLETRNALTSPSTLSCNTYKRVQQFLNNSTTKMKLAANRKRRHSASQNFYQQQHLHYGNNNNNSDGITDLNAYKQELNDTFKATKEQQQQQQVITPNNDDMNVEEQPAKQAIITCKYWTAATNSTQSSLGSTAAAMMFLAAASNANSANNFITAAATDNYNQGDVLLDENIFGNTFSCLIDKNASILKHVTMMTRPLTR